MLSFHPTSNTLPNQETDPNCINTPNVKICKKIQSLGLGYICSSVSSIYTVVLAVGSFNQISYKKNLNVFQSLLPYFDTIKSKDIIWGIPEYIFLKPFVLHSRNSWLKGFIFVTCFPKIIVIVDKVKTLRESQLF